MNKIKLKWKRALPNFVITGFFFLMLLFLSFLCGSSVKASDKEASENQLPFSPGEQLVYQIRWDTIDAGVASFNVQPVIKVGERPCRHFSLKVETSPLVDVLYQIRDQLDSYTDLDLNRSVCYSKKETGSEQRDILVQFDWEQGVARYSNFNAPREPITIPSGTFDPLAAFYKIRGMDLGNKKEIKFPITDGKKCFMGRATVVGQETITCFNTTYDTYVIEPEVIHFGGVFEKSDKPMLRFWITRDERRLPVRIQSKVIVGSIIGELVSIR
ncbi:MAG TPA: DUF3108 domain-containing protein [Desulfobacter sp.]|uniref:DUF3108 domain-containing protein n=1 Tax=Desulfobacter sp. UBA2225 TaxID=1961413 RepID=UPI000E8E0A38|nr:DUF3108 domain-containing protein [Desulfobacter sp. UBA2225]HAR34247.1 DUF3108 domain-containing protein [Desulfobacter sp.]